MLINNEQNYKLIENRKNFKCYLNSQSNIKETYKTQFFCLSCQCNRKEFELIRNKMLNLCCINAIKTASVSQSII